MKARNSKWLFLGALLLTAISSASADKLCLQTTVNKKTLKVTQKSTVAAKCPKGYTALADTSQFQGPRGVQGARGILDLNACRGETAQCLHNAGANTCSFNCNEGEFLLQYTAGSASDFCVTGPVLSTPFGVQYSNGLGAGVTAFTSAPCSYRTTINVLCCPTS